MAWVPQVCPVCDAFHLGIDGPLLASQCYSTPRCKAHVQQKRCAAQGLVYRTTSHGPERLFWECAIKFGAEEAIGESAFYVPRWISIVANHFGATSYAADFVERFGSDENVIGSILTICDLDEFVAITIYLEGKAHARV